MRIIKMTGRMRTAATFSLGGVNLDFVLCNLENGDVAMTAPIPADDLRAVKRQAARMGGLYQIVEDDSPIIDSEVEAEAAPVSAPKISIQARVAFRNGWSVEDVAGTGLGGNPGKLGGFSPITGLTMAEMALCVPPKAWAEMRDVAYPWEAAAWRPPGVQFVPPAVPSKVVEPEPEPTEQDLLEAEALPSEVTLGKIVDSEAYAEALASGAIAELTDGDLVKDLRGDNYVDTADDDEDTDEDMDADHEDDLADYGTQSEIAGARELLVGLIDVAGGKIPTPSKMRYHLKKHGLPSATASHARALLSPLT